jgi:hypothetical protein
MRRLALLTTSSVLAVLAATGAALAADVPRPPSAVTVPYSHSAVSAVNGKVGAFAGNIDGVSGWGLVGAWSMPLSQQWGLQIDGLAGTAGGSAFWGAAGHVFWRDPSRGLIGVYGSWVDWSTIGARVSKIGIEGEAYNGRFSLEGKLVQQGGTFSGFAGSATLAYYAQDNLRLDGSFRYLQGIGGIGTLGAEWQANSSGFAIFGNGSWGQNGYTTVVGGVKFYAGPQKTLIRRQREDDPGVGLPLDLFQNTPSCNPQITDGCFLTTG